MNLLLNSCFIAIFANLAFGLKLPLSPTKHLIDSPRQLSKGSILIRGLRTDQKNTLVRSFQTLCLFQPSDDIADTLDWTADLKNNVISQTTSPSDNEEDLFIKRVFVDSLVDEVAAKCKEDPTKRPKQNEDIYEGVGEILTNVFSGNLFGVIQSSVGIRTPEGVSGALQQAMRQFLETLEGAREAISRFRPGGGGGGAGGGAGGASGAASGAAGALGGAAQGANRVTQAAGTGTQAVNNAQLNGNRYVQGVQQQTVQQQGTNVYNPAFQQVQQIQGIQQQGVYNPAFQQVQQVQGTGINQVPQQNPNYNNVQQQASNFKGQVVYQIKV